MSEFALRPIAEMQNSAVEISNAIALTIPLFHVRRVRAFGKNNIKDFE